MSHAEAILNSDLHGLTDVKKNVLEYFAHGNLRFDVSRTAGLTSTSNNLAIGCEQVG